TIVSSTARSSRGSSPTSGAVWRTPPCCWPEGLGGPHRDAGLRADWWLQRGDRGAVRGWGPSDSLKSARSKQLRSAETIAHAQWSRRSIVVSTTGPATAGQGRRGRHSLENSR